jgi:hypothetical protein
MAPLLKQSFYFDKRLKLPAHALYVGATLSGKSHLLLRILKQAPEIFNPVPKLILLYYAEEQDEYEEAMRQIQAKGIAMELHQGCDLDLAELANYVPKDGQTLVIVDDATEATSKSTKIANIFMNGRHKKISLWLMWHTLFPGTQQSRDINQNVGYYFLLPCPRARGQIQCLGNQIGMGKRLPAAYDMCRTQPKDDRYLLLDLTADTPEQLMVRSKIVDSAYQYAYL